MNFDNAHILNRFVKAGWDDTSYGNDVCPSVAKAFEHDGQAYEFRLWINFADPDHREEGYETEFAVSVYTDPNDDFDFISGWDLDARPAPEALLELNMDKVKFAIEDYRKRA